MNLFADRLATVLKRLPKHAPPPDHARSAAIAALTAAIRAQAERRRRRVVVSAIAAIAAVAIGFAGASLALRKRFDGLEIEAAHKALVTRGEASEAIARGGRIGVGARLETTSEGSVRMKFPTGSELWLDQHSAFELLSVGDDQAMRLSAGRVLAQVAPLRSGQRFRVLTPDTELAVRGTRFTVEWLQAPRCDGQAATRVDVEEGTVWVRHGTDEALVHAGESWPPPCPAAVAAAPLPAIAVEEEPAVASPRPAPSRLAEENRRFAEVQKERQAGRTAHALILLDALRRDFPRGHLEEDVAAEELRLLQDGDPSRAARAAKAYLGRFPNGYARALADELSARP